jgi:DNA-3-methyladenine glycosylase
MYRHFIYLHAITSCLSRDFYECNTPTVARKLLGKKLVRVIFERSKEPQRLAGIITETEAYGGNDDPASHAFGGSTPRSSIMFGANGTCYVYFVYGMYHCTNVVAYSKKNEAGAVLIRSVFPVEGINSMMKNRKIKKFTELANGPGKVSMAMLIDKSLNRLDLTDSKSCLHIEEGIKSSRVRSTPRIGITFGKDLNWRFVLGDNVSSCLQILRH